MTIDQTLQQALQYHHSGNLSQAQAAYRAILAQQPTHADALHLLGVLAHQAGHHSAGLELIDRAIAQRPSEPQYRVNRAIVLDALSRLDEAADEFEHAALLQPDNPQRLANLSLARRKAGQLDAALAAARRLLQLQPDSPDAHNNIGYVLHAQKKYRQAISAYQQAINLNPHLSHAHANLALALGEIRQWDAAIIQCRQALALNPTDAETYCTLAHFQCSLGNFADAIASCRHAIALRPDLVRAHVNLAAALRDARDFSQSVQICRAALARFPASAALHNALGHALVAQEKLDDAIAECRLAIQLDPNFPLAHNNLGLALDRRGDCLDAIPALRQAIRLSPDFAEAHNNLANALSHAGDQPAAIASLQRALSIWPDYPSAHWNLGLVYLLLGDYPRGWNEYEWRWQVRDFGLHLNFTLPRWTGDPLNGRRILLHAEQGFGDIIQLARFIPMVAARGGPITLACQGELHRLFNSSFPNIQCVTSPDQAAGCDVQCPIMSLPNVFAATLQTLPASRYLHPDPQLVAHWGHRLPNDLQKKIGLTWWNRPTPPHRCPPPSDWSILKDLRNCCFISLQKENAQAKPPGLPMLDFTPDLADFAQTAALIVCLDAVVTVDTAVAHLAGALHKPTLLVLKQIPDWRWLLNRPDSPWYPTIKLFRQTTTTDWQDPLATLKSHLNLSVLSV